MKRTLIGGAVIALLAFGAIAVAVTYEPPDRSGCAALLRQAEHTSDVAAEIEARGCLPATSGQDLTARP